MKTICKIIHILHKDKKNMIMKRGKDLSINIPKSDARRKEDKINDVDEHFGFQFKNDFRGKSKLQE